MFYSIRFFQPFQNDWLKNQSKHRIFHLKLEWNPVKIVEVWKLDRAKEAGGEPEPDV